MNIKQLFNNLIKVAKGAQSAANKYQLFSEISDKVEFDKEWQKIAKMIPLKVIQGLSMSMVVWKVFWKQKFLIGINNRKQQERIKENLQLILPVFSFI